jgi:integrase/recombinase XerD
VCAENLLTLAELLPSWQLALRSANRSPRTITTYTAGVNSFLSWCQRTGTPLELTKVNAQRWIADLIDGGAQSATATIWLGALKRFSAWLADEGEIPADPLVRMPAPRVDRKVTNCLTDERSSCC